MTTIVIRSLWIAVVLGAVMTGVSSILMTTYHQSSEVLGINNVLTGYDAIQATINAFGIGGYLRGLIGAFVLYFLGIFIGSFLQGVLTLQRSRVA